MKFEWLNLVREEGNSGYITAIAEVPGGWVLKNMSWDENENIVQSESMVFIPDPDHEWKI